MITCLKSCAIAGIDGRIVDVEVDVSKGFSQFDIVGLPDTAVKESRERVRNALKNCAVNMPARHYIVNLAPADLKKAGVFFDLPIAVGILAGTGVIKLENTESMMFIGELSLTGELRRVSGVLPAAIAAREAGIKKLFVPYENAYEAAVAEGVEVYPFRDLNDVIKHFTGEKQTECFKLDINTIFNEGKKYPFDFSEVKGQEGVKRALEIAAAGGHNCIMTGTPGSGKTMLAKRFPTILPDLTFEEALEVTKIHSIAGLVPDKTPLITKRPFRSPHHTVSAAGLSGGGAVPKPGEVSLAHNGVLFLDEFPEFRKDAIEILRQPLEDGVITVSRVNATVRYPCNVMMIVSKNPCKCGYYGDPNHECTCTASQIHQYNSKISGPVMDRIDLHIRVNPVEYSDLENPTPAESSADIKKRVDKARKLQLERFCGEGIYSNSQMQTKHIRKYCVLGDEENALLKRSFEKLGLSARAYDRILKVARTIADLDGSENIQKKHIAEAISYRSLDRDSRKD